MSIRIYKGPQSGLSVFPTWVTVLSDPEYMSDTNGVD